MKDAPDGELLHGFRFDVASRELRKGVPVRPDVGGHYVTLVVA